MHNFSAIVGHQRLKRYGRNEKRSDEVVKVINRDERGAGGGGCLWGCRARNAAKYNTCNVGNH